MPLIGIACGRLLGGHVWRDGRCHWRHCLKQSHSLIELSWVLNTLLRFGAWNCTAKNESETKVKCTLPSWSISPGPTTDCLCGHGRTVQQWAIAFWPLSLCDLINEKFAFSVGNYWWWGQQDEQHTAAPPRTKAPNQYGQWPSVADAHNVHLLSIGRQSAFHSATFSLTHESLFLLKWHHQEDLVSRRFMWDTSQQTCDAKGQVI